MSGNEEDDDEDDACFGAEKDDDGDDSKLFAPPFNRLAMRSAALFLLVLFDTLSDALSLVAGVPGCCCFLNCFVFVEAALLMARDVVLVGANVCCCCRFCCSLLLVADIWRCIELAAAAANKAARVEPPSAALVGGDGGTAVGEAVIVRGASLVGFDSHYLKNKKVNNEVGKDIRERGLERLIYYYTV